MLQCYTNLLPFEALLKTLLRQCLPAIPRTRLTERKVTKKNRELGELATLIKLLYVDLDIF